MDARALLIAAVLAMLASFGLGVVVGVAARALA